MHGHGLDVLGAQYEIGADMDWAKFAGGVAEAAVSTAQNEDAAQKASSSDKAKLQAVVEADLAAASAMATTLTSAAQAQSAPAGKAKEDAQAKARADLAASNITDAADDAAAAFLPASLIPARVAAATKSLTAATTKLQASPTDIYTQNLVKAWQSVLTKAQNLQIVKAEDKNAQLKKNGKDGVEEESFWTRKVVGPVPGWGVVAGGGVVVAGAVWHKAIIGVVRKIFG